MASQKGSSCFKSLDVELICALMLSGKGLAGSLWGICCSGSGGFMSTSWAWGFDLVWPEPSPFSDKSMSATQPFSARALWIKHGVQPKPVQQNLVCRPRFFQQNPICRPELLQQIPSLQPETPPCFRPEPFKNRSVRRQSPPNKMTVFCHGCCNGITVFG